MNCAKRGISRLVESPELSVVDKVVTFAKKKIPKYVWSVVRFLFLFGLAFVVLQPIISALSISLRDAQDIKDPSVIWIPKHFTLENILRAIDMMKFGEALKNTLLIGMVSSVLQVISCMIVGYGFARFQFKGKGILFGLAIVTIVIPPQTLYIPTYFLYNSFGLIDTVWSMYLPAFFGVGIRSGLFIYIFRQFYRNLPKELEDAALVDGCGHYRAFFKVILPCVRTAIITVFLFSLVWYWNDYYYTGMYFYNTTTVTTALSNLQSALAIEARADRITMSVTMQAGSLLSILPVLLVYVVFHRFFTEGIERSGIVG